MLKIAVISKKGGVGKTTTVTAMAWAATELGFSVGVLDLDQQASATLGLGAEPDDRMAELLMGAIQLDDAWVDTEHGIRLVPSNASTLEAERRLAADPLNGLKSLREALKAGTQNPDVLLIDTRPDEAHGTLNALVAADEVWVTAEPVPATLEVMPRVFEVIETITNGFNPQLRVTAIIPTRFENNTTLHTACVEGLQSVYGSVVTHPIPRAVAVAEAHGAKVPVTKYAPLSPPSIAYRDLAKQLLASVEVSA